mmetsp:Transcript_59018/g.164914  ORF Transcript_59018/g.164914 Transcript_59018/m.164914 type:complete len:157 (-) Transcript_59018:1151-1621(-)
MAAVAPAVTPGRLPPFAVLRAATAVEPQRAADAMVAAVATAAAGTAVAAAATATEEEGSTVRIFEAALAAKEDRGLEMAAKPPPQRFTGVGARSGGGGGAGGGSTGAGGSSFAAAGGVGGETAGLGATGVGVVGVLGRGNGLPLQASQRPKARPAP